MSWLTTSDLPPTGDEAGAMTHTSHDVTAGYEEKSGVANGGGLSYAWGVGLTTSEVSDEWELDGFDHAAAVAWGARPATRDLQTATINLGREIRFGLEASRHIGKKKRPQNELEERLQSLDRAEETVRDPQEIWKDPRSQREKYVRIIADKETGRLVLNVVTEHGAHSYSWHANATSLDHYRSGILVYRKP